MRGPQALKRMACALLLTAVSTSAGATIIASYDGGNFGVAAGFGPGNNAVGSSPIFSVAVNGSSIFSAAPANGDNVFDLSGAALSAIASALANGIADSYQFQVKFGIANPPGPPSDVTELRTATETQFTGASNLPGATILGIRISLLGFCFQPTTAGGCSDPGPDFIGFNSQLLVEVSDTPFPHGVAEPSTALLFCFGLITVYLSRGRRPHCAT